MAQRNTQWRRRRILDLLDASGEVAVEALAQEFHTSEVTIRKDLGALESHGLLLRRHGGAIPLPQKPLRAGAAASAVKQKIARLAAAQIRHHSRIIIDSGNTTAALLPELGKLQGLVVMTNSLGIAQSLLALDNQPTLLMPGGTWDARSEAFQGQLAEQMLRAYDFDQLFIGADGLDLERGTTTFNELYGLSRVMAEVAAEVIVLAESDKLGRKIHNLELPWSVIDLLVTDANLSDDNKHTIEQQGVRVLCA
ncbi:DeoR/GlpR family DNA-binding transcription regulator [Gilvimarinus algae]|uniref:DeoR family transcriptional regulator n=1 Tax=Gilvimarinus algae TaxID=3058037 RepID=A0ABT8TH74_9GAMM|nr:DeoR family transcriptional regulator [Gilvimarinus sp. SDUM040014]MDO3381642.1 DeoR family transcriptional regulator [Gilvimarinus sp. SDUM040014]